MAILLLKMQGGVVERRMDNILFTVGCVFCVLLASKVKVR